MTAWGALLSNAQIPQTDLPAMGAWVAPTMLNSWVDYGGSGPPVGFRKDQYEHVHLRGQVKSGTGIGFPGNPIFILPVGYRPARRRLFLIVSNSALGRLDVAGTSDVTPGAVTCVAGSNVIVQLDGIVVPI